MARIIFQTRANEPGSNYGAHIPYSNLLTYLPRVGERVVLPSVAAMVETIEHHPEHDEVYVLCVRDPKEQS